jgi:short-subunit dehydrogenase
MSQLAGRVAVVTGAATGIGRATALELARRGCDLALITRSNASGLEATASEIESMGRRSTVHMADVRDREAMAQQAEAIERAHGKIHILVNNAGVTLMGDFQDQTFENMDWIIDINLWGVLNGTKLFLPALMRQDWGHICNISSLQGILPLTTQTTYTATKFAVRGFSESLRGELSPHNIGVSEVFPGLVKTEIVNAARAEGEESARAQRNLAKFVDRYALDADACAKKIVKGIEKNRARTLVTASTVFFDLMKRLMPSATDTIVARMMRRGIPDI